MKLKKLNRINKSLKMLARVNRPNLCVLEVYEVELELETGEIIVFQRNEYRDGRIIELVSIDGGEFHLPVDDGSEIYSIIEKVFNHFDSVMLDETNTEIDTMDWE